MASWEEGKHPRRPDGEFTHGLSNYPKLHEKPVKVLTPSAKPQTREQQLAAMDPETRALALAQEETRKYNPGLERPLGTPEQGSEILQAWLKDSGIRMADSAYVVRHPNPGDGHSNSGRGPDGEPMVALHPDRWDYGTLAHEAAHLLYHQQNPGDHGTEGKHGSHGAGFIDHYARLLNRVAKGAGDDLKAAYNDQTASRALTETHEKVGHTGKGLWGHKSMQLPAYVQHVANDLIAAGHPESEAVQMAIGVIKNWVRGGENVKPETRAKAVEALAEWERLKAQAHATAKRATVDEWLGRSWSPSQPRVPAGGPTGGQFGAASGSGKDTRATPGNANPVGHGETGQRVTDLQKRLNELGAKLKVDGKFGPKTLAALKAFQKEHGLKPDGLVGPKTTTALRTKAPVRKPLAAKTPAARKTPAAKTPAKGPAAKGPAKTPAKAPAKAPAKTPAKHPTAHQAHQAHQAHLAHLAHSTTARALMDEKISRAQLTASSINDLPDSAFGFIEPGGSKDKDGKTVPRSLRHFPIHDAAHIRNALARAPQSPFGDKAMGKIRAAAKKAGVQVSDDNSGNDSASRAMAGEIFRYYPLDDIRIMRSADGEGSGRVVEAYATVFDEPAEIYDGQGHYLEVIDRGAFDVTLARLARTRGGFGSAVRVLFNHGKTMEGQPAPEFQLPIGKPLDIRPDGRGLLTRTEYDADDPFAERVLSKIRAGSITGQSFVGGIVRSDPELRGPGDKYRGRAGALTTVRRMALGLREYGPVLYGAYTGAEFLGVRMRSPGEVDPDGFDETVNDFDETVIEETVPANEEDGAAGTREEVTSTRAHPHQLLALRTAEICREHGIGPVKGVWG